MPTEKVYVPATSCAENPRPSGWRANSTGVPEASTSEVAVPEGKTVKNRLHIDVSPIDSSQDEEVERLLALGARRVDIGQGDVGWVVLSDPEGNEFCVLRSLQEP